VRSPFISTEVSRLIKAKKALEKVHPAHQKVSIAPVFLPFSLHLYLAKAKIKAKEEHDVDMWRNDDNAKFKTVEAYIPRNRYNTFVKRSDEFVKQQKREKYKEFKMRTALLGEQESPVLICQ